MKTVYIVSHGEYSDYSVDAICMTHALATEIAARMGRGYDVEERPLIRSAKEIYRTTLYCVQIKGDGSVDRSWTYEQESWSGQTLTSRAWRWGQVPVAMGVSPRGTDVALKIARDKLAEFKAAEAGVSP